jgi:hypothetical protein
MKSDYEEKTIFVYGNLDVDCPCYFDLHSVHEFYKFAYDYLPNSNEKGEFALTENEFNQLFVNARIYSGDKLEHLCFNAYLPDGTRKFYDFDCGTFEVKEW